MRLKAEIWVMAYVRRLNGMGVPAMVVRRGDDQAGAIYIKVNALDGRAMLFCPAPAGADMPEGERRWVRFFKDALVAEAQADAALARERAFDPDIWIVEIEDRQCRHFLDDWLMDG